LDLYEECRVLSLKDRIKHPKIPMKRAKYIVVALGLIKYVIDKYGVDRLYISPYALKEGVLASNI
jgi:exopolyphosphatase / guanosine-5'-triphosphate,3'-diphosphate pyrophosphatase